MFPQPWSPTKSFPHPLSNRGFGSKWSKKNYLSYVMVDTLMWVGLGGMINQFRQTLDLGKSHGSDIPGDSLLHAWKVPISHMYSPSFVAKCKGTLHWASAKLIYYYSFSLSRIPVVTNNWLT